MAAILQPALNRPANPRVSVCIANYNGETLLMDCIDSVLAQDTEELVEILVHDDASSDGSLELLRTHYPQVCVLASSKNVGFCASNNRMVSHARGEYVLLLNNDAKLLPDALRSLIFTANGLQTPAILTLPQYDWELKSLVDRGCLLDPFHVPVPNHNPDLEGVAYVIGACLWIPRATWDCVGGFPEWLGSIAEDMFLCRIARLQGMPVSCTNASGYFHRQGMSFGGNRIDKDRIRTRYKRRYLSERNRIAVLVTCMPTWIVWPLLAVHVLAMLIEAAALSATMSSVKPWRKIYWPAIRDTWRNKGNLLKVRRDLQNKRTISLSGYLGDFRVMPHKLRMLRKHGLPEFND